jgi:hypothetical protein
VDGWRRREIGISGGESLRRQRPTQGCSEKKKKKNSSVHVIWVIKKIEDKMGWKFSVHRTDGKGIKILVTKSDRKS